MENGRVEGVKRQYVESEFNCSEVGVAGWSCYTIKVLHKELIADRYKDASNPRRHH